MKTTLKLVAILLFSSTVIAADKTNLALINIDGIGFKSLTEIKNNPNIDWWVEMGDKMVVAVKSGNIANLPKHIVIVASKKNINISQLSFQSLGHCNHNDTSEKIHTDLEVIFANSSYQIVNTENSPNKEQLLSHDLLTPFAKNHVLAYQYVNRQHDKRLKTTNDIQLLVDKVDEDRWFSQVEYLASLDRMLDSDLIIAGQWLENKFSELGLVTSRVDMSGYRGFNVLGFKQGTTLADEWIVVGAHLDSRNENWDDNSPSPGAEDNASGCSGVLEIANVVSQYETESSILFVCFSAEENGLLGSQEVITQLTNDGDIDKVITMLNLDMIGYRLGSRNIAIAGTDASRFEDLANHVAQNGTLYTEIDWQISTNMCCTDFRSFTAAGIPAVTTNQPDIITYFGYHSSQDLSENLDPVLGAGIVKANLATLADLVGVNFNPSTYLITEANSGLWYNQAQSGHGLSVEILVNNRILANWYTFDNDGQQMWLVAVGTYEGNTATLDVTISEQGMFPPNFVAEDVVHSNWGTFEFEFTDCNSANFSWSVNDDFDFADGELQLSRLTILAGLSCEVEN